MIINSDFYLHCAHIKYVENFTGDVSLQSQIDRIKQMQIMLVSYFSHTNKFPYTMGWIVFFSSINLHNVKSQAEARLN